MNTPVGLGNRLKFLYPFSHFARYSMPKLLILLLLTTSSTLPGVFCCARFLCGFFNADNITDQCPSHCHCQCSEVYCNSSLVTILNGTLNRPDIFSSLSNKNILLLDLSRNGISQIEDGFFDKLNIQTCHLILSHNNLTEIRGPELEGIEAHKLYLSHNAIDRISPYAFGSWSFRVSRLLDISFNKITYFEPWPYTQRCDKFRTMNLSHNSINSFRNSLNLTIVDIMQEQTSGCGERQTDLSYNNFSVWVLDDLRRVYHWNTDLDTLDSMKLYSMGLLLGPNQWICDCKFYEFRSLLQESFTLPMSVTVVQWFNCAAPPHLRGQSAAHVPLEDLVCPVHQECPVSCVCESVPVYGYTRVHCNNSVFTSLPNQMPSGPLFLNLSQNQITNLEFRPYLSRLKVLDLSYNRLVSVDKDAVRELQSVTAPGINLDSNSLTTLPKEIQVVKFSFVNLGDNPLKCSCDLTWVSDWIDVSSDDPANQRSVCYMSDGSTMLLVNMAHALDCISDIVVPVVVGVTITFAMVILIAVSCRLWGKKKLPFLMYLVRGRRIRPDEQDEDNDRHYDYDVYLSFDNENMDIILWVKNVLLENLEKIDPVFRVCCPLRDFDVGVGQADEILIRFDRSRRFVSIVSRNYFDHLQMTAFEYDLATHKNKDGDSNMMMIMYDDIDLGRVHCEAAKKVLNRKAYLKRDHYLFWKKLRYFIASGLKTY